MHKSKAVRSMVYVGDQLWHDRRGWKWWTTLGGLGLLLTAAVVGWRWPVAQLARVRVTGRRDRRF
jgi:hypothetical protein